MKSHNTSENASFICPACETAPMKPFYNIDKTPAHSVLLLQSHEEAVNFPCGDIALGFCDACGFVANMAFDLALNDYSAEYEATQGFSATFNAFAQRVAEDLIERHDLRNKHLIEIGCGQGEFLTLLCELGNNSGIGFDPAYRKHTIDSTAKDRMTFVSELYTEEHVGIQADAVICKMTLEHIQPVLSFMRTVRQAVGDNPDTLVFFQIPNASYVFGEMAFWDVYYEHVSYFSKGSLARLFRKAGFDVTRLDTDYDDQYLMIEAHPRVGEEALPPLPEEDDIAAMRDFITQFAETIPAQLDQWRSVIADLEQRDQKAVIWGGGSKGVSFLTALGVTEAIRYAVDINPLKHGTFMAGTGQAIVGPEFLKEYQPGTVIVMNPVYCDEIRQDLTRIGVDADLLAL